jgi:hypothetical protein
MPALRGTMRSYRTRREDSSRNENRDNLLARRARLQFLVREQGIRQFVDIGPGLPTQGNVHQLARQHDPGAHVVYVDNDDVVLTHGRSLLNGLLDVTIIRGDLREPEPILADPELRALIDFSALTMTSTLGWHSPLVLGLLAVAVVVGICFVAVEHRVGEPMLPPALFTSSAFSGATGVGLLFNFGLYGVLFCLTIFLERTLRQSTAVTGVALLPLLAVWGDHSGAVALAVFGRAPGRRRARRCPARQHRVATVHYGCIGPGLAAPAAAHDLGRHRLPDSHRRHLHRCRRRGFMWLMCRSGIGWIVPPDCCRFRRRRRRPG